MSKKLIKPFSLAVGTAIVTTLAASNAAAATDNNTNPFAITELSSGYMQMIAYGDSKAEGEEKGHDKKYGKEGKCGEGKCGDKKEMKKNMEGKCGEKKSEKEGKCGEGKCGSNK
jgi:uncharacterized low-complexity protein